MHHAENPYLIDQVKHLKSPVIIESPDNKWANDDFFEIPAADGSGIELNQGLNRNSEKYNQFEFELPIDKVKEV